MTNQVAKKSNTSVSTVINQAIEEFDNMIAKDHFDLPEKYSYKNAIQQTRFLLTKPFESGKNQGKTLLDVCTPTSIMQSVIEMAQKGLNPSKEQCYFIPYGDTCNLSISYQGKIAMAKRDGDDIKDVYGYAVYKDDEFELEFNIVNGTYNIKTYKPDVTKWSKDTLIGAFAIILDSQDKIKFTEYMTMEQIRSAWNMGAMKGGSPAHKNFPDQMAIKTVKSRAVKSFINSSNDEDLMSYEEKSIKATDESFSNELEKNANLLELDTEYEVIDEETTQNADEEDGEIIDSEISEKEQQSILNNVPF